VGLDITVYRKLHPAPEGCEAAFNPHVLDYPERANGLPSGPVHGEVVFGFRAGSYSGYNEWREQLAKLAGYPAVLHRSSWEKEQRARHAAGAWAATEGPFWELINFSDCEGTIGPRVAFKLAKDFAEWQERADAIDDDYFKSKYAEWRRAFETAQDFGAVDFH
jgi:hypothetical protein